MLVGGVRGVVPRPRIPTGVREAVTENEQDKRDAWIDDYGTSILRFTDFPHLRQLIVANQPRFTKVFGNDSAFKNRMTFLEPLRNRIAHVNTLSSDDWYDFIRDANAILDLVRPHVRL